VTAGILVAKAYNFWFLLAKGPGIMYGKFTKDNNSIKILNKTYGYKIVTWNY
jgi:hypothetical protein